ncbi:LAMI_0H12926g1_1 [Lachancea mirantina]|uniref:Lon protease homolog, mitochondrial n=1 Tax=Lachancea mirantina TaxID=1230905 RepID=A0A1G4KHJ4_9SACH|nr:LAMI_0H12926g1_1 [Lachancea mirantina]
MNTNRLVSSNLPPRKGSNIIPVELFKAFKMFKRGSIVVGARSKPASFRGIRFATESARYSRGTTALPTHESAHWKAYLSQNRDLRDLKPFWNLPRIAGAMESKSSKDRSRNEPNQKNDDVGENKEDGKETPDRKIEKHEDTEVESDTVSETRERESSKASGGSGSSGNNDDSGGASSGNGDNGDSKSSGKKQVMPEVYPQMLALPISRRPLFPGFYKAVVISDNRVMKAVKEMLERQQPYIGAFLLKNSDKDTDVIHNIDEVHEVGVFAQITSAFPSKDEKTGEETMTALLYPHRRIKIDELIPPKATAEPSRQDEILLKRDEDAETTDVVEHVENVKIERNQKDSQESIDFDEESNPTEFLKNYDISLVNVSNLEDKEFDRKSPVINALTSEILKVFKEISQLNTMFREQIATFSASIQSATTNIFEEPARLADFAAAVSAGEEQELQDILELLDVEQRLEKSLVVLKKELMNAELQNKISKDVETKIQKRQREYYLMEQLKGIKRELGIDDGRDKLIETFKKRVEKLQLPENVKKVYEDEIGKLATLETSMSEFGVIRNYLDWITSLPWGITSKEQYSIPVAKKILDEDHYGLKDVKDRILEFIAVGKLLGKVDGKIICFVGPPGVGKTSIGKSIARALDRQFSRFSVGGMTDVAEIKGHRRTYIGALPGRIVQSLKKCQTQNPLILIDEIDKIGHGGIHGDPAAALLELLDPEQNNSFLDNYLDIPIDLSKVLFVCTANTLDTIPRPLLDRMEVIELTGYVADEKIKIAEQYLSPNAKKAAGLENANVNISETAITNLMKHYCRESGVRNLRKQIEKIYRKAAFDVVKQLSIDDKPVESAQASEAKRFSKADVNVGVIGSTLDSASERNEKIEVEKTHDSKEAMVIPSNISVQIDADNLKKYVGPPIFTADRLYEMTPPGVVMGLAWTSMGGCAMYVESVLEQPLSHHSHASLERTGQLGDVMKESSRLAYSFAKMFLTKKYPENRFFEKAAIHLHCPEGATPKDGPSAGVTMASSLLSLALNKQLDPTIAMTGELTLTGKVLRIGGLREKAVAAKRSGAKTIIFPKENTSDWEELPENVKEGLEPLAACWYSDIFEKLFADVSAEAGNSVWKAAFDKIDAQEARKKN